MLVHWSYEALPVKFSIYPPSKSAILTEVHIWNIWESHAVTGFSVSGIVKSANGVVALYPATMARSILSNMMEKGSVILDSLGHSADFGFTMFSFDPAHGGQGDCAFVLGLEEPSWQSVYEEMKFAAANRLAVSFRGNGGFSVAEDNPHSRNPTWEQFELGWPILLNNFTISTKFPDSRLPEERND